MHHALFLRNAITDAEVGSSCDVLDMPQATPSCFIEGTFIVCVPILCQFE